jgi:hypothetical protein
MSITTQRIDARLGPPGVSSRKSFLFRVYGQCYSSVGLTLFVRSCPLRKTTYLRLLASFAIRVLLVLVLPQSLLKLNEVGHTILVRSAIYRVLWRGDGAMNPFVFPRLGSCNPLRCA